MKMPDRLKYLCDSCSWTGTDNEILNAPHPFIAGDTVLGCPKCKEMELMRACVWDDCWDKITCGLNTPGGYKQLCSKHGMPFFQTSG